MLTELGLGSGDYLQAQHRQSATVGALNAFTSMRGAVDDEQAVGGYFVLSAKALLRNAGEQARLMHDTLHACASTKPSASASWSASSARAATSQSPAAVTAWPWPPPAPE